MKDQLVLSHLHLHAVLPRLADVARFDDKAADIARRMNGTIQFKVQGGPSRYVTFEGGAVNSGRGNAPTSDVAMLFVNSRQLNNMFLGKTVVPIVYKGIWRVKLLKDFQELSKCMEDYLKNPDYVAQKSEEHKRFVVKLLLTIAANGIKEVGEQEAHGKKLAGKTPDGILDIRVGGTDIAVHIEKFGNNFRVGEGASKKPNTIMTFKDVDIAFEMLRNRLDSMAALGSLDITIQGMVPMVDNLGAVMGIAGKYLEG